MANLVHPLKYIVAGYISSILEMLFMWALVLNNLAHIDSYTILLTLVGNQYYFKHT